MNLFFDRDELKLVDSSSPCILPFNYRHNIATTLVLKTLSYLFKNFLRMPARKEHIALVKRGNFCFLGIRLTQYSTDKLRHRGIISCVWYHAENVGKRTIPALFERFLCNDVSYLAFF